MQLAIELNITATQILTDSSSLNSSSAELVDDVATATEEVEQLEQAVMDDTETIASATNAASQSIMLSADILRRVTVINVS